MRILSLLVKIAVFLLLLGFAVKNMDGVTLRYFLGLEWQVPMAFALLVVFAVGILAGILTNLAVIARQHRELLAVRRELQAQRQSGVRAPVEGV